MWDKTKTSNQPTSISGMSDVIGTPSNNQVLTYDAIAGKWTPKAVSASGVTDNPLTGKTWNVLGDSLTEINGHSSKFYHQFIKEWDSMTTVNNYGVSGSTIANGSNPMSVRYATMEAIADYITVFAGVNDFGGNGGSGAMGTFTDSTNTTFYGACHVLFKGLLAKYPDKKIGYIAPHYQTTFFAEPNVQGLLLEDYVNAAIKVAKYYAIPVLDLFHEGTISARVLEQKTLYTTDGLHLNLAGQQRIAVQIRNFLKSL